MSDKQPCDCLSKVNAQLAAHNTVLAYKESINMKTGKISNVLPVPTQKINKRGPSAKVVFPIYCVFCGQKRVAP